MANPRKKGDVGIESVSQRKIRALENLGNFSKNLMFLLIAVIAFASSPSLNDTAFWIQICFTTGVVFAIISFICGHESILKTIDPYIKHDKHGNLLSENETINIGTLKSVKRWVERQYWLSLISILLISFSVISSVLTEKNDDKIIKYIITDKHISNHISEIEKFEIEIHKKANSDDAKSIAAD